MQTRVEYGFEDWREYHVISDATREQDPVTFWRPKAGSPGINESGFRVDFPSEKPKPKNTYRIISYGDLNTEGGMGFGNWSRATPPIKDCSGFC